MKLKSTLMMQKVVSEKLSKYDYSNNGEKVVF